MSASSARCSSCNGSTITAEGWVACITCGSRTPVRRSDSKPPGQRFHNARRSGHRSRVAPSGAQNRNQRRTVATKHKAYYVNNNPQLAGLGRGAAPQAGFPGKVDEHGYPRTRGSWVAGGSYCGCVQGS